MHLSHLYVDHDQHAHPLVAAIEERTGLRAIPVADACEAHSRLAEAARGEDAVAWGKRTLHLTVNRGAFLKACPGTRAYTCCGYQILHAASFCPMDCSYCILQAYFHPPVLQLFLNQQELFQELSDFLARPGMRRVGTGEFTDSLVWESLLPEFTPRLVDAFARQSHAVLELKTKTVAVAGLEGLDHRRRTIVAWSLNTPRVIASDERGTASLEARLRAAARCREWGYPLAFHLDPMVVYDGCEAEYEALIDRLFAHVAPADIVWISLGTLRFMPALKTVMQRRFPDSTLVYGEFIPGLDNKMRYFKPLRLRLYKAVCDRIRRWAPRACVYLCMEDDVAWRRALGFLPQERGGLAAMLDRRAAACCLGEAGGS
jgi:spore photoproduct lyase